MRWDDVRHILLTHIHLDHAGAAGTIVRAHPHIKVFVHDRGAGHMADPQKLIDSAARLYRRTTWNGCGVRSRLFPRRTSSA